MIYDRIDRIYEEEDLWNFQKNKESFSMTVIVIIIVSIDISSHRYYFSCLISKNLFTINIYDIIVKYYLLKKEKESLIEKNFTYLTYNIRQAKFQEIFFQKI